VCHAASVVTVVLTVFVDVVAAGATDAGRRMPLRKSSFCNTSPALLTGTTIADIDLKVSDPTTNDDVKQPAMKRSASNVERCFTERRARTLGADVVDSCSDLMELLEVPDPDLGSGEFVRSRSQRGRRRSRVTIEGLTDSRERVTPSPTCSATSDTTDCDDLPPSLSRSGPGRWSLRERQTSRGTSSPPLRASARWARNMATRSSQDTDRPTSVGRRFSDDCTATEIERLLESPDYSLEQRRQARRQQQSSPSVLTTSDLDDNQHEPPTPDRMTRWTPIVGDGSQSSSLSGNCSRRDQLIDAAINRRRSSMCDVDRTIHDVEEIGKQIDGVVSEAATASDNEDIDSDNEEEPTHLRRSATLPRRWRCRGQISNVENPMEEIPEFPLGQKYHQRGIPLVLDSQTLHSDAANSNSSTETGATVKAQSYGNTDDVQVRASAHLAEIPGVSLTSTSVALDTRELGQPVQSDSPVMTADETTTTSRPTSAEFDTESTSSGSRDEGFESAVDSGMSSSRSYPDFDVLQLDDQPPPSPRALTVKSGAATPCDGDESVSAGTSFFARSIDSLVLPHQELVISGDTIDIDQPDTDSSVQDTSESQSIAKSTDQPTCVSKGSASNKKSGSSKSLFLANLTARLARPRKSTSSVNQSGSSTDKQNGTDAKQPASSSAAVTRTGGPSTGTVTGTGAKSAFVRGSLLRATMPASLRNVQTKKSSTAPEPPQRTTSNSNSIQTAHRSSPATARQLRVATSRNESLSAARKSHGEITSKTDKQINEQTPAVPARGRVATGEQSKNRDRARSTGQEAQGGRDKLVMYKAVEKTTKSSSSTVSNSRKQVVNTNNEVYRTQRLVSFNTPQQSRKFRF